MKPYEKPETLEIWINNPNSGTGWHKSLGPFTSRRKTEKRLRDHLMFECAKGCKGKIKTIEP